MWVKNKNIQHPTSVKNIRFLGILGGIRKSTYYCCYILKYMTKLCQVLIFASFRRLIHSP